MATLITTTGERKKYSPFADFGGFKESELFELLDCDAIHYVYIKSLIGTVVLIDENAKRNDKPINKEATELLKEAIEVDACPSVIYGDVLICSPGEL